LPVRLPGQRGSTTCRHLRRASIAHVRTCSSWANADAPQWYTTARGGSERQLSSNRHDAFRNQARRFGSTHLAEARAQRLRARRNLKHHGPTKAALMNRAHDVGPRG
jgi:hypothetical protein